MINKLKNRLLKSRVSSSRKGIIYKVAEKIGVFSNYSERDGVVLIEGLLRTPKNNIEKNIIAKAITTKHKLSPVVLLKHIKLNSNSNHYFYSKFGVDKFASLESAFVNPLFVIKSIFLSLSFIFSGKTSSEIIKYKYRGVQIGDLLYDSIIRENPSVFSVDGINICRDSVLVFKMYLYFCFYDSLTNKYDVRFFVTSHKTYFQYGLLCKLVKKKGGVVFLKDVNLYKIYDDISIEEHIMSPDAEVVLTNYDNVDFVRCSNKYIEDRFRGEAENMDVDVVSAFHNKVTYTKPQLMAALNIENDKPIVFVMPHAFSDSPHVGEGMLFNDYYHWLVETLKSLSLNPVCNVIVKPHPTSYCWGEMGVVEELIQRLDFKNVHIAPTDINTNSVPLVADIVITCQGTIALESVCFGVPSIVAGNGYFSGYNISISFDTASLYLSYLETADFTHSVSDEQKKMARVILYTEISSRIYSSMVPMGDILPADDYYHEENKVWAEIADLVVGYDLDNDPLYMRTCGYLNNNPRVKRS